MYELGDYDEKIRTIEAEIQRINGEKEAALLNFDENIKSSIVAEIEAKEMPRINEAEGKLQEIVTQREAMEEIVKETTLKITSDYEAYIGKSFSSVEKIDSLIKLIESGQATTISQAIDIYKAE